MNLFTQILSILEDDLAHDHDCAQKATERIMKLTDRGVIGENQGYRDVDYGFDEEDAEKFNKLIETRNELRVEQRSHLKTVKEEV